MTNEPYTKRELDILHEALTKQIKNGFDGVHTRQDFTNGKVIGNKEEIKKIKENLNKITLSIVLAFGLIVGMGITDFSQILNIFI